MPKVGTQLPESSKVLNFEPLNHQKTYLGAEIFDTFGGSMYDLV